MLKFIRTNSQHQDFRTLVNKLDALLEVNNGAEHSFYAQFNVIDAIQHVVIAYNNDVAVGCGAIKEYEPNCMEVKRMYVEETERGKGIAQGVLKELEQWAKELGYQKCILETDEKLKSAVTLYKKTNYTVIPNYGQYEQVKTSICFEKIL